MYLNSKKKSHMAMEEEKALKLHSIFRLYIRRPHMIIIIVLIEIDILLFAHQIRCLLAFNSISKVLIVYVGPTLTQRHNHKAINIQYLF